MRMRGLFMYVLGLAVGAAVAAQQGPPLDGPGGMGPRGGRGMGMGMMGHGVVGTVTEVAADHYTLRNDSGETWTVHYSVNTRIMKQPAGQRDEGGPRTPPQQIKPDDIKVGDMIGAGGEVDNTAKSVGAVFIMQLDPETAKRMHEMQANFGKTWLAGRVTAINETTVTIHSGVDDAEHNFTADENTTFRRHREPITLADIQVGDNVRVEGAVKAGTFTATSVLVMMPPAQGGPMRPHSEEPPK